MCAGAHKLEEIVAGFKKENQPIIIKALGAIWNTVQKFRKPVWDKTVENADGAAAVESLKKTESAENLTSLVKILSA